VVVLGVEKSAAGAERGADPVADQTAEQRAADGAERFTAGVVPCLYGHAGNACVQAIRPARGGDEPIESEFDLRPGALAGALNFRDMAVHGRAADTAVFRRNVEHSERVADASGTRIDDVIDLARELRAGADRRGRGERNEDGETGEECGFEGTG
jgi:hypothetical protein